MSEQEIIDNETGEVIQMQNAMQVADRASIDMQIATAHQYPRSIKTFLDNAMMMATMNEDIAAQCFYKLPRRDKNGKNIQIEGPSVRLAEIMANNWKNLRCSSEITDDNGKFVTATAMVHDLETNVAYKMSCQRRVTTKDGKRYGDDMTQQTKNAACAIALRNAIFKAVPKVFVDEVFEKAKKVSVGESVTLEQRRNKALSFFQNKHGVDTEKVLKALGKKDISEIGLPELETMIGWTTALKDGVAKLDSIFVPEETKPQEKPADDSKVDYLRLSNEGMQTMGFTALESDLIKDFYKSDIKKMYDDLTEVAKAKDRKEAKAKLLNSVTK